MGKILANKEVVKKISIFLLLISFTLVYYQYNLKQEEFSLDYELINTKDMAMVAVPEKKKTSSKEKSNSVFAIYKEMKNGTYEQQESPVAVSLPAKSNTVATLETPKRV